MCVYFLSSLLHGLQLIIPICLQVGNNLHDYKVLSRRLLIKFLGGKVWHLSQIDALYVKQVRY